MHGVVPRPGMALGGTRDGAGRNGWCGLLTLGAAYCGGLLCGAALWASLRPRVQALLHARRGAAKQPPLAAASAEPPAGGHADSQAASCSEEDVPENAPEECPGIMSESAGKAEACEGCPNRSICATGEMQNTNASLKAVTANISNVAKKILVLSGKGGVGKSTFTAQIAWALRTRGLRVGVLDVDVCGPSIPRMMGCRPDATVHQSGDGWSPVFVPAYGIADETVPGAAAGKSAGGGPDASGGEASISTAGAGEGEPADVAAAGVAAAGVAAAGVAASGTTAVDDPALPPIAVMSIGFLLPNADDAVIWRGPKKNGLIKQFLTDVQWGPLDVLIVDTPPGTSDEHLSIITYLGDVGIDGALVVTTPQEVSLQDVRKEINFCRKVHLPVLGVVENMADSVFSEGSMGSAVESCARLGAPYAGKVSLCPELLRAGEAGRGVAPASAPGAQLAAVIDRTIAPLLQPPPNGASAGG